MTLAEMAQHMIKRNLTPLETIEDRVGKLYLTGYIGINEFVSLHDLIAAASTPTEAPAEETQEAE